MADGGAGTRTRAEMAERGDLEALFLAHRDLIGRIAAAAGRRQGLRGDDLEDFASWTTTRLIEGDYAVLAQFRGESSLATYLTVVVTMLAREYRVRLWGRWRPSAAARRQGPLAVRLETLVHRDGLRLDEAAQTLRTAGLTTLPDRALAAILAQCPARTASRAERVDAADGVPVDLVPGDGAADDALLGQEADDERRSVGARLSAAVDQLPAEERVMVRLRYWQGLSVADVARALGVPQKPLYRRLERVLETLRAELARQGVDREQVRTLLGEPLPDDAAAARHQPDHRPPNSSVRARAGDARSPPRGDSETAQPSM